MATETQAWPWLTSYPAGIAWDMRFPERSLVAYLEDSVARFPERPCLDFLGKSYSYGEVGDLVRRASQGFAALGIGPGSRVGLMLPNTPYYAIAFYAVLRAGGTVVNINPLYAERELQRLIDDSGATVVLTLDLRPIWDVLERLRGKTALETIVTCPMAEILPFAKSLLYRAFRRRASAHPARGKGHLWFDELVANDGTMSARPVDPRRDVAVLQYTGGTTGVPKGAMLSHANLAANMLQCRAWFPHFTPGAERTVAVLPFFHVFAMTVLLNLPISIGEEIVLLPRFELTQLLKTIDRKRPTTFAGVPTLFTAMMGAKHLNRYDLTSIRSCISGGAPLPVELKAQFEALTSCTLVEGYGLSETSPVVTCNPLSGINKPGSVGLPVPGTIVEIVSLDDPDRVLPIGERGEVTVRGPQVMLGYWKNPEATAQVLRKGRLYTGDVGFLDRDGYLFLVDRIKDMIKAGGYNVYPRVIEEAIYTNPKVRECIVVGVPDPYRGQTIKAFIAVQEDQHLDEAELTAFLKDKLSPMEMPKLVEFRESLPKTLIGKPSKQALLDEEQARAARSKPTGRSGA
jgi:long-chain acyl-CoA synthetase